MIKNVIFKIIMIIVSGILTGLPFYFPNLYFLSWFSLVPLLLVIQNQSPKLAFGSGWLSGLFFFVIIFYWVVYPQLIFDMPLNLALSFTLLLCGVLAIFIGAFALLGNYVIKREQSLVIFWIPVIWTGLEYLRSVSTFNLLFGAIGYSQAYFPLFIQIADLFGVYGVTFFIILINVFIYKLILYLRDAFLNKISLDRINILNKSDIIYFSLILLFVVGYGLINLKMPINEKVKSLKVGLIQPNIAQEIKWSRDSRVNIIDRYFRLTGQVKNKGVDIIFWPETAIPFVLNEENGFWQNYLFRKISRINTPLFTGALNKIDGKVYNQVFLVNTNAQITDSYNKMSLVPFGEYIPLRNIMPTNIKELMSDKSAGEKINSFSLNGFKWGSPICSEILNPELVSKIARDNHFLVNPSNEAWFKKSNASLEIWQTAIFRAVENRIPIIKVSNTGISGIINAHGKIKMQLKPFKATSSIWNLKIPNKKKETIYNRYNDYFIYLIGLMALLLFIRSKKKDFNK
ncbi:MAG: apolipoprotein N-acyltransferase [Candidatus Frackibacter sp. T328-2]|nr:MAG: apolipoprotein N-acyltransferase [Candidatus Frackibacter sp. T328-2]